MPVLSNSKLKLKDVTIANNILSSKAEKVEVAEGKIKKYKQKYSLVKSGKNISDVTEDPRKDEPLKRVIYGSNFQMNHAICFP